MRTILVGGLLASAGLCSRTCPRTSPPPAAPEPAAQSTVPKSQSEMWRSSKLIGLNVYNDRERSSAPSAKFCSTSLERLISS